MSSGLYFGEPWDTPAVEYAAPWPTPVGEPCMNCGEAIVEGDRGWIYRVVPAGRTHPAVMHAECQLIGVAGHLNGVCWCSGYDSARRDSARELWRRLDMDRSERRPK